LRPPYKKAVCTCLELATLLKKLGTDYWCGCDACCYAIVEAKNDLVRENAALEAEIASLQKMVNGLAARCAGQAEVRDPRPETARRIEMGKQK
jgi:hypothetical protein